MRDRHYAVVVGVNAYPAFRSLNHAVTDAESVRAWLVDPAGGALPRANVKMVTTPPGIGHETPVQDARPTLDQVMDAIEDCAAACRGGDPASWGETRLYVYLSGHGLAPKAGETVLLLANVTPGSLGRNISCRSVEQYFVESGDFAEVVIIADCCRNIAGNAPVSPLLLTAARKNNGEISRFIGFATSVGDPAFEPPADSTAPGSYFTAALLEGLRGAAFRNGAVDSVTLGEYVAARTTELTAHRPRPQSAYTEAKGKRIVFAATPAAPPVSVRFAFSGAPPGAVRIFDNDDNALGEYPVGNGVAAATLPRRGLFRAEPDAGAPFQNGGLFRAFPGENHVTL